MRLLVKFIFLTLCFLVISGCATKVYNRTLKSTSLNQTYIDKTVTLRFLEMSSTNKNKGYWVGASKVKSDRVYGNLLYRKYFKNVDVREFKIADSELINENDLNNIINKNKITFETDYLIDIVRKYEYLPHRSHPGFYGSLVSILSLGTIPHIVRLNDEYIIYIYSKGEEEGTSINFKDHYKAISASWQRFSKDSVEFNDVFNQLNQDVSHHILNTIFAKIEELETLKGSR